MTQELLLKELRGANPTLRLAASADGDAIGVFVKNYGRFVMVRSKAITGEWVDTSGREILINGQPPYAAGDWKE